MEIEAWMEGETEARARQCETAKTGVVVHLAVGERD